jgi:DNA-binding beta-propeller fold protein YncE
MKGGEQMKKALILALPLFLLLVAAGSADALLLGTDWNFSSSAGNASLYSIDTSTATATLIGDTGVNSLIGLVVDTDSTVYAISEEASSNLWTLDPTTGAATLVGSLGFNLQEGDMTIDPVTGMMYVADGIGDKLYTVDKTTGSATLVGSFGTDGRDVSGLQFFDDTLYALALRDSLGDVLLTIDPSTAAATLVGTTGTNFGVIAAMGRDPESGTTFIGGPETGFGSDNELYALDLTTGAATLVDDLLGINFSVSGFSVAGEPDILFGVPEPGTMLLLGFGLVGLGAARRKL